MYITRRQFVLGTTAGLVLPSFYDKTLTYFENHGEPLLIAPKHSGDILYACPEFAQEGYQLNLGHPECGPPRMSIREFCLEYGEGDREQWWREFWLGIDDDSVPVDMDIEMDPGAVEEWWEVKHSPCWRAYQYLSGIDLGPQLSGGRAVGGLDFYLGGTPGGGYQAVDAVDEVSLSLLQQRLNELRTGIELQIY